MCKTIFIPCDKEHEPVGSDGLWLAMAWVALVMTAQALWWLTRKTAVAVRWSAPRVWRASVRFVRWCRQRRADRVRRPVAVSSRRESPAIAADRGVVWSEVADKKPANA